MNKENSTRMMLQSVKSSSFMIENLLSSKSTESHQQEESCERRSCAMPPKKRMCMSDHSAQELNCISPPLPTPSLLAQSQLMLANYQQLCQQNLMSLNSKCHFNLKQFHSTSTPSSDMFSHFLAMSKNFNHRNEILNSSLGYSTASPTSSSSANTTTSSDVFFNSNSNSSSFVDSAAPSPLITPSFVSKLDYSSRTATLNDVSNRFRLDPAPSAFKRVSHVREDSSISSSDGELKYEHAEESDYDYDDEEEEAESEVEIEDHEASNSATAAGVLNKEADSRVRAPKRRMERREKKEWQCPTCSKIFDRPSLLQRHIRTHTGEKPHACDVCGKAFSTSSSLNTHRRIHSGEKPHACNLCGKTFTASSNLYYHKLTHTTDKPHKCTECSKSFSTPGDLRCHMHVHNGTWPFKCPLCSRGFSKLTNMKNHMLTHTGAKPFSCQKCDKQFSLQCNLKSHMKTHHGDDLDSSN